MVPIVYPADADEEQQQQAQPTKQPTRTMQQPGPAGLLLPAGLPQGGPAGAGPGGGPSGGPGGLPLLPAVPAAQAVNILSPLLRVFTDPDSGEMSVRVGSRLFPVFELEASGNQTLGKGKVDVKASGSGSFFTINHGLNFVYFCAYSRKSGYRSACQMVTWSTLHLKSDQATGSCVQ